MGQLKRPANKTHHVVGRVTRNRYLWQETKYQYRT
jgi:hypothetical protein